ncbi:polysaccharide deacetylase family protein [bacterium]|nr:polysaccharide deacetylase family protein [bacterium]
MKIIPIYYHLVSNKKNPLVENLYKHKDIDSFKKDLHALVKKYRILDLADLKANRKGLVLSFDDGFAECYQVIFPILKELSIPAFFFVNNDFIDNKSMFYRAKLSLIVSKLGYLNPLIHQQLAYILECKITEISERLLAILDGNNAKIDSLLTLANIDIDNFLNYRKPYLTSEQIFEMSKAGYYFGGHTHDHLKLTGMTAQEQERRIVESSLDISQRFNLDYKLCSLPHNDLGISREVFQKVGQKIDYLFGGYGLNHQPEFNYYQRISNEHSSLRIDRFINNWKIFHYVTSNVRQARNKFLK